jgi:hypothetical protein
VVNAVLPTSELEFHVRRMPFDVRKNYDASGDSLPFADTRYCSERLIGSIQRECVDHIIDSGSRCV